MIQLHQLHESCRQLIKLGSLKQHFSSPHFSRQPIAFIQSITTKYVLYQLDPEKNSDGHIQ